MKILFVNPPVIRYQNTSPENDQRLKSFLLRIKLRYKGHILYNLLDIIGVGKGMRYGVRAGSRWPWTQDTPFDALHYPFIMGYAAGYLKENGYDVNIIDAVAEEQYSYDSFIGKVEKERADIVVVECSTPTIDIDLWMAKRISQFAKVALAGPHLTIKAEDVKREHPYITFLLKGEYIKSALKMVETIKPGVYESEVVTDIDSIPFPFRDYNSSVNYYDPTMPTARPQLQIYGSKGCPFKCSFCMWPQTMYQGNVSLRKPEKVAQEIRESVEKYGFKSIFFDDDTFNLGTQRISKLCKELAVIGLPWTMMGRLDCSPDWLYDKMIDCGCVGMRFGIETFNVNVLKKVNKGIERVDFKNTLKYLSEKYPDLMIHVTMMKDLPGQSEDIHQCDMKILEGLGYSGHNVYRSYQLASCAPFPGTQLYNDIAEEMGEEFLADYSHYDGGQDTIMKTMNK
ncbi:MAG: radical SAM protein [Nitrospinae bacterium]|nr:radical SAM protein [Nitrospinota bacterium]